MSYRVRPLWGVTASNVVLVGVCKTLVSALERLL